MSLYSLVRGSS